MTMTAESRPDARLDSPLDAPRATHLFAHVAAPVDVPHGGLRPLMQRVLACDASQRSPLLREFEHEVRSASVALRDAGAKPEHMVVALKRATARDPLRAVLREEDDLHYRMILWGVRAYFRCDA